MEENCKDGWWGLDNEESEGENGKKIQCTQYVCTDLVCIHVVDEQCYAYLMIQQHASNCLRWVQQITNERRQTKKNQRFDYFVCAHSSRSEVGAPEPLACCIHINLKKNKEK